MRAEAEPVVNEADDNGNTREQAKLWRAYHAQALKQIECAVMAAPSQREAARRIALLRYELLEMLNNLSKYNTREPHNG